jgi:ferredoxin-NADP reductase
MAIFDRFVRGEKLHKVIEVIKITPQLFIIRFMRDDLDFISGQHLSVSIPGTGIQREYSIYSSVNDDYLEILFRVVPSGVLTPRLSDLRKGESIIVDGPHGYFKLPDEPLKHKYLFVATGSGIAPFHSFVKSYPDIDYKLLHGIRFPFEKCSPEDYSSDRLIYCFSRGVDNSYSGRVTDYLTDLVIEQDTLVYFCGSSQMILDAWQILISKGIKPEQMKQEIYF